MDLQKVVEELKVMVEQAAVAELKVLVEGKSDEIIDLLFAKVEALIPVAFIDATLEAEKPAIKAAAKKELLFLVEKLQPAPVVAPV